MILTGDSNCNWLDLLIETSIVEQQLFIDFRRFRPEFFRPMLPLPMSAVKCFQLRIKNYATCVNLVLGK